MISEFLDYSAQKVSSGCLLRDCGALRSFSVLSLPPSLSAPSLLLWFVDLCRDVSAARKRMVIFTF